MSGNTQPRWDPLSARSWADAIGLIHLPLFGHARQQLPRGDQSVLLDGKAASVAFFAGDPALIHDDDPLSWSWSSNLLYSLVVNEATDSVFIRSLDFPTGHKRRLPRSPLDAINLHQEIEKTKTASSANVISRMLKAFKAVRSVVSPYSSDNLPSLKLFNAFLVATENVVLGRIAERELAGCETVADILAYGTGNIEGADEELKDAPIFDVTPYFLDRDPLTNCRLHPDLLIRHASGALYQEAHFELERQQNYERTLFGRPPITTERGSRQRDARYTPPELARSLAEQAIGNSMLAKTSLDILDPACGSGVFLLEVFRELEARGYRGAVTLRGFDTSPLSVEMARFCLHRAVLESTGAGITVKFDVQLANALKAPWGTPDVVLMNPPFAGFKDMSEEDQGLAREALGNLAYGHIDKAMAFVWLAGKSLAGRGTLASVIPSPLLDSTQAISWRQALLEHGTIKAVGRFKGYSFFTGAMVEPAFIVFDFSHATPQTEGVATVLVAEQGSEGKSLRALRRGPRVELKLGDDISLSFDTERKWFDPITWLPRNKRQRELLSVLSGMGLPTVGELFDVRQGILTGSNKTFLISQDEYHALDESEKMYFRLAAGTSTIRMGVLAPVEYVFYPYDAQGIVLPDEDALRASVPWFFENRLEPNQPELKSRRNKDELWWTLTEHRAWQRRGAPKLISAYFGDAGSFAYDERGEYAIVQGYGWIRSDTLIVPDDENGEEIEVDVPFHGTDAPWTYLALLNSRVFELLLSFSCPRVQGGQFNLSKRFVSKVLLPDLLFDNRIANDTLAGLTEIGRWIHAGRDWNDHELSELSARAYGIHLDAWGLEERVYDEWQRPR